MERTESAETVAGFVGAELAKIGQQFGRSDFVASGRRRVFPALAQHRVPRPEKSDSNFLVLLPFVPVDDMASEFGGGGRRRRRRHRRRAVGHGGRGGERRQPVGRRAVDALR